MDHDTMPYTPVSPASSAQSSPAVCAPLSQGLPSPDNGRIVLVQIVIPVADFE